MKKKLLQLVPVLHVKKDNKRLKIDATRLRITSPSQTQLDRTLLMIPW